jgi:hypothetical protein
VPSSSFSCSNAGSYSSNFRVSSLSDANSASRLAIKPSTSLIDFARESRVISSSFRVPACASADGTEAGRVEETRAASRPLESAVQWDIGKLQQSIVFRAQPTFQIGIRFIQFLLSLRFSGGNPFFRCHNGEIVLLRINDRQHVPNSFTEKN